MRLYPLVLLLLCVDFIHASPQVEGYERFGSPAVLYSELGCANCHGGSKVEIKRSGPSLSGLRSRVNFDWVNDFLTPPHDVHSGSNMPLMTHGLKGDEITAITLFLGSIGKKNRLTPQRHANPERGKLLYHEKGCVACHAPTARNPETNAEIKVSSMVSFPDLRKKYSLASLDHFLANVSDYRRDGRMPHFALTKDESIDIASHLLDFKGSDPRQAHPIRPWPNGSKEQLETGKKLFQQLNCTACHDLPGILKPKLLPLNAAQGACIGEDLKPGVPWYPLNDKQRKDLAAFIENPKSRPIDTLAALNCLACHSRNGLGGPSTTSDPFFTGDPSLGDSGRLPPPLTGIGHKLTTPWLKQVLLGKPASRVRPYLKTQMPSYHAHADKLATWLSRIDQKPNAPKIKDLPVDGLNAGRQLLSNKGGYNCVTCHNWADKKSPGIQGLEISNLHHRLRPEWFREYLLHPTAYRPNTLMPAFWPNGKASIPQVLGGDTEKQIASIWHFIKDGKGIPTGYKDSAAGKFELIPRDRPLIQRTFLKETGTKAILVGFPGKIHLSFDAHSGKPSLVWRGRFFDAYGTWFTRAAPFESPLGDEVHRFEPSVEKYRFRGYLIDDQGNPEFLLERGETSIREHYRVADGKLIRTISWDKENLPPCPPLKGVKSEMTEKGNKRIVVYFAE